MEKIKIDSKFADQSGEIMVVELGGHVDQSNSYQLQKMFENIIQSGCYKVIVDFSELFYMSSAGWGIFVGEIKRFRENGGDIKLANMNPEIYDVYQMLEFYHILEDYPMVEDAALSFRKEEDELNFVLDNEEKDENNKLVTEINSNTEKIDLVDRIEMNVNVNDSKISSEAQEESAEVIDFIPSNGREQDMGRKALTEFIPHTLKKDVKLAELPIAEKVKRVVAQNPLAGAFGIRKVLRHEHFGNTRIGILRLIRLLKNLDLHTKEKRYRYYRSC